MDAYIISRVTEDGNTVIIKIECVNSKEFKMTAVNNNQITDCYIFPTIDQTVSNCISLQKRVFGRYIAVFDTIKEELLKLKESN